MKRYAHELASAVSAVAQARWAVELLEPVQRRWISQLCGGKHSERLESAVSRYVAYPLTLRSRQADVFHVLDHGYGHLVRALDPARTIVTCHDLIPLLSADRRVPMRVPSSVVTTFRFRIKEMARASRILADSVATRDSLLEYTDIPAARIVVIPLGVNECFAPCEPWQAQSIRQRLNVSTDAKVVLQVATRGRHKNTPCLLRALAKLRHKLGPHVVLVRVGAPLHEDEVALAHRLSVMAGMRFIGVVPDDRALADWYRAATVLAFPSLWEGFGWPPLEAMASGTPVVASDIPAISATVGHAADLINPEDDGALAAALERIITDADHARDLRSRGLEQVKTFTWDITARRTLAVYDEVAGTSLFDEVGYHARPADRTRPTSGAGALDPTRC